MDKKLAVRITLAIWVIIWILFLIRPYFKKNLLKEYSVLLRSSTEEKRACVFGQRLYGFVKFCNASLPPSSSYEIIGLEEHPLDRRRMVYCLYPNAEKEPHEFLLVYGIKDYYRKGYSSYKSMASEQYILRKAD